MNILALELGMSRVSAAVLDVATAQPVGEIAHDYYLPGAIGNDGLEVHTPRLWCVLTDVARRAVRRAGVAGQNSADIAGIGLTTFSSGLVLLDKSDQPLSPIWMPNDRRARPAARQVWAHVGPEFQAAIGCRPLPGFISAVTYRQHLSVDPYISHRVASYLHVNGWLALHMTGQKAFDPGQASATGLFTLTDETWTQRWCDYFEVERAWLPPIIDGSATVGSLRAAVAAELGVPAGIPVKLGTEMFGSKMLAAGMEPGDVLHSVGLTQALAALTDHPTAAPRRWIHRLGVGPRFMHVTHNPIGGGAVSWLHGLCFRDQTDAEFCETTLPQAMERATRVTFEGPCGGVELEAYRAGFRDLDFATDRLDLLAALIKAMRQRHEEAVANLGQGEPRRIFLADAAVPIPQRLEPAYQPGGTHRGRFIKGTGIHMIRRLLPGYETDKVTILEEGSLRGVARLFQDSVG